MHLSISERLGLAFLLLVVCLAPASAQDIPLGNLPVGYSFNLDFGVGLRQLAPILAAYPQFYKGFTFAFTASGNLPPALTLTSDGLLSGTLTTPGSYSFTITESFTFLYADNLNIPPFTYSAPISLSMVVTGSATGGTVSALPGGLSFNAVQGAGPLQQSITISNTRSTPFAFSASASGGTWLVSPAGGNVPAFGQATVSVTVNPAGLAPGTYTGAVSISGGGTNLGVPVVLTVTGNGPLLQLSQSGLFFQGTASGPTPPTQSFAVANGGTGTMNWSAAASTQSGGGWLSISPTSGASAGAQSPSVTVTANPGTLAAGTYYGQIQVSAPGVANSPQTITVVFNVAAANKPPDPDVRPTALVFVGVQGGTDPAPQNIKLTNLAPAAVSYTTTTSYSQGSGWITLNPANGTITAGTPATPAVAPKLTGLKAGIYNGQVTIAFLPSGSIRRVAILLIVLPAGSATPLERGAAGCPPTKLLPLFSALGQSFTTAAAWPVGLEVTVVDDCGTPITTGGSVIASFSNGDDPIPLNSTRDGKYSGTWVPKNSATAAVTITASAQTTSPALSGVTSIGGSSTANPGVPLIKSGAIVNAASNASRIPLAPGSYVAIYGSGFGSGLSVANKLPFPTTLNGTQVLLGGSPVPLYFTSAGQINALIPYNTPTNTSQQLLVVNGNSFSVPEAVTFSDGGPGVFTVDSSGQGSAIVQAFKSDGTPYTLSTSTPASAGDVLVIYANGLGAVSGGVVAGSASPSSPPASTTNPVTVTIQGQSAGVEFAGLVPGFAGLYQVNVSVPTGLTPSAAAPLVITVANQSSPPTTIPVK
jgi:uncharacterized protein (TIGR03437 family)